MVQDLSLDIDIQQGLTSRAGDGLALSSRNQYLSDAERQIAPRLWQALQQCAQTLRGAANVSAENTLAQASLDLEAAGFTVHYLELRELQTLTTATDLSRDCALFVAATLGTTRLIDNIQISAAG
jgi:pantoate--beta-alanine ligase